MIDRSHRLPLARQARELEISRGSVYYLPKPVSAADLAIMRRMDELHLEFPFAGSRMLRDLLRQEGIEIGRQHVATLMKKMALARLMSACCRFFVPPTNRMISSSSSCPRPGEAQLNTTPREAPRPQNGAEAAELAPAIVTEWTRLARGRMPWPTGTGMERNR